MNDPVLEQRELTIIIIIIIIIMIIIIIIIIIMTLLSCQLHLALENLHC